MLPGKTWRRIKWNILLLDYNFVVSTMIQLLSLQLLFFSSIVKDADLSKLFHFTKMLCFRHTQVVKKQHLLPYTSYQHLLRNEQTLMYQQFFLFVFVFNFLCFFLARILLTQLLSFVIFFVYVFFVCLFVSFFDILEPFDTCKKGLCIRKQR
jgi:hypothetical protein